MIQHQHKTHIVITCIYWYVSTEVRRDRITNNKNAVQLKIQFLEVIVL